MQADIREDDKLCPICKNEHIVGKTDNFTIVILECKGCGYERTIYRQEKIYS